jgi:microcystin-dependent protein
VKDKILSALGLRAEGSPGVRDGYGWTVGAVVTLPVCNITRRGEERRVEGATDSKVICESVDSVYAWNPVTPHPTQTPPGVIVMYGAASAPDGWLLCDGSEVSRTTYAALFAIIGTTYGSAGGTTFTLPNFKSRMPFGLESGQTANDTLGETGGARDVTLTAAQSGLPAHEHIYDRHDHSNVDKTTGGSNAANNVNNTPTSTTGGTAQNAAQSHTNMPPFITVNFVIKT